MKKTKYADAFFYFFIKRKKILTSMDVCGKKYENAQNVVSD